MRESVGHVPKRSVRNPPGLDMRAPFSLRIGHCRKGLGRVLLTPPAGAAAGLLAVSAASVMIGCGPTVKEPESQPKEGGSIKRRSAAQMIGMEHSLPRDLIVPFFTLLRRKSGGNTGWHTGPHFH